MRLLGVHEQVSNRVLRGLRVHFPFSHTIRKEWMIDHYGIFFVAQLKV